MFNCPQIAGKQIATPKRNIHFVSDRESERYRLQNQQNLVCRPIDAYTAQWLSKCLLMALYTPCCTSLPNGRITHGAKEFLETESTLTISTSSMQRLPSPSGRGGTRPDEKPSESG